MPIFGDLLPDRLRRSNGSYAIYFSPVSGDGNNDGIPSVAASAELAVQMSDFLNAPARHICRKISGGLRPVDNFQVVRLSLP